MNTKTVLKRSRSASYSTGITILVIWDQKLLSTFCEALEFYFTEIQKHKTTKIRLEILSCQYVQQILSETDELWADYIVILLDTRLRTCVKEIESNLQLIDRGFICGQLCVVNAFSHIPLKDMAVTVNEINAFRFKYHCPILNANIMDQKSSQHLAHRIFNLINSSLGLKLTVPFIGWWIKD